MSPPSRTELAIPHCACAQFQNYRSCTSSACTRAWTEHGIWPCNPVSERPPPLRARRHPRTQQARHRLSRCARRHPSMANTAPPSKATMAATPRPAALSSPPSSPSNGEPILTGSALPWQQQPAKGSQPITLSTAMSPPAIHRSEHADHAGAHDATTLPLSIPTSCSVSL